MKNTIIKSWSVMFLVLLTLSGCDDFLKFDAYGPDSSDSFWKTENDALLAADALESWRAREGIDGRGFMWFENCSDNLVTGRPQAQGDQIKNFQMAAGNGRDAKDNFSQMYQVITIANNILKMVPAMSISTQVKDDVLGRAYFYRAFAYLWLVPWYCDNGPNGGLPIITENTATDEIDGPRPGSVLANYDMIIADLRQAGELLPYLSEMPKERYGLPHKGAAWGYAARAALYAAQYDAKYYETVIEMCDKVMDMTGADKRDLHPNFGDLWRIENNFSSEFLYSNLGNEIDGPKFHGMSFHNGGWGLYNTWGYYQPTLELYKAYETGDQRRDATFLFPGQSMTFVGQKITLGVDAITTSTSGFLFRKFMAPFETADCAGKTVNSNGNNSSNRLGTCYLRFADVLLMKAEALIWSKGEGNGEAKILLNRIRHRAGLPENSEATKEQLKNERRCELAFEFQPSRHLDLVRWGDAQKVYAKPLHGVKSEYDASTGKVNIQEVEIWPARNFNPKIHHVFPIPASDIDKCKNLKQNNGY